MNRTQEEIDREFMQRALDTARDSLDSEDVPVGAVVVMDRHIVGRGCNQREKLADPTAHAEIIALSAAAAYRQQWRLDGCTMYVTLEPCVMCAGALVLSRIDRLVYAAADPKAGAAGSVFNITSDVRLNHQIVTVGGVLEAEAAELLREFFRHRRSLGEK
jgi:tRNA(adenine34) deaminase